MAARNDKAWPCITHGTDDAPRMIRAARSMAVPVRPADCYCRMILLTNRGGLGTDSGRTQGGLAADRNGTTGTARPERTTDVARGISVRHTAQPFGKRKPPEIQPTRNMTRSEPVIAQLEHHTWRFKKTS